MAPSDLSVLLDMGFDKEKAELAAKESGGLQGAIDWLEKNQDKDIDEIRAFHASSVADDADETDPTIEPAPLKQGEEAKSLTCNDCGKRFRSVAQAEFHASKTEHQNFSESTEEIAPLTEEQKKEKLAELRQKANERKALKEKADSAERRANEKIRMKSTQEIQTIKEDLEKKEQIKEAARKRQEKKDDIAAKQRIKDKIAADKEERRLKAEKAKAEREGRAPPPDPSSVSAAAAAQAVAAATTSAPRSAPTETRLRFQTATGNITKTFSVETTLFEVATSLEEDGVETNSFTMTFPKKIFEGSLDFGKTLKEAGMVPSAVLIVK